jgi:hypothetical protein
MMVALETVLKTCPLHSAFLKGIRWFGMSKSGKRCGDDGDTRLHFGVIGRISKFFLK